jgi:Matrixin
MSRPSLVRFVAILVAALWLGPGDSDAFWARRSPKNRLTMSLGVGTSAMDTVGYGRQSWNSLAEMALVRWNANGIGRTPDHAFFSSTGGSATGQCSRNGVNEVRFAPTDCDGFGLGDAVAVSFLWLDQGRIVEADVTFDRNTPWNAYPGPLREATGGGTLYDFFRVAVHEFGHAFGLGHPEEIGQSVDAVMNAVVSDTDDLRADDIAGARAIAWSPDGGMGPVLNAAVLPASRSVRVGIPATAFATIINTAPADALSCSIGPAIPLPVNFTFQTTNPATNQPTGAINAPTAIPAAGQQTFVLALTPTADLPSTDVPFSFDCSNTDGAPAISGINTLLLSGSNTAVPDVIALAATPTGDGIVNAPRGGVGAFAVASVNVGAAGSIVAAADTGGTALPLTLTVCQTDPATGACAAPAGPTASVQIGANATLTFSVFVRADGQVSFDPAVNRVFLWFRDSTGAVRGATSVAVRTP